MYHLLIVEDEEIIRNALPLIIDWNAVGFDVVDAVGGAAKALKIIEEKNVDVVLTDIKMPMVSGLELACELKSRFPGIKTILLSAYRDFSFALKGIEYGVYGYLLKSDSNEEIREYFRKLKEELDHERIAISYYQTRDHSGPENPWPQSRSFLQKMIESKDFPNPKTLAIEGMNLGINLAHPFFTVAVIELDRRGEMMHRSGEEGFKALCAFLRNLVFSIVESGKKGYVVDIENRVCVILTLNESGVRSFLRTLFQNLNDELEIGQFGKNYEISVSCGVGHTVDNLEKIGESADMAMEVLSQKAFLGGGRLLFREGIGEAACDENDMSWLDAMVQDIVTLLAEKHFSLITARLDLVEMRLKQERVRNLNEIADTCCRLLQQAAIEFSKPFYRSQPMPLNVNDYILLIRLADTLQGIFTRVKEFFFSMETILSGEEMTARVGSIVEKALYFIQKQYTSDLRLDEVASTVNVHPVHLCRLFSQETGLTFKEILTKIRIDKAKDLLADVRYKVYEVSLAVGYMKPRYFSDLFKKVTGMTPLEYREKMRHSGEGSIHA